MVAAVTTPDTNDVSQFLSTLILTGDIEASVSRLYEHVPEIEREASVNKVMESLYSRLPNAVALQIQQHQNVLSGRVAKRRQKVELHSGRKYTVFGGLKKIALLLLAFWILFLGAAYFLHRHSLHQPLSPSGARSVTDHF
jgi:hypothetical protein